MFKSTNICARSLPANDSCLQICVCHLIYITLLLTMIIPNKCESFETYFPVSDVHVTLPNNEKIVSILQDRPLLQFTAKSFHELSYQRYLQEEPVAPIISSSPTSAIPFNYEVYTTDDSPLSINRQSGVISMTNDQFRRLGSNATVIVKASIAINGTHRTDKYDAKMSLTILMRPELSRPNYCSDLAKVCFWDSIVYKVAENINLWNQTVGQIGPNIYRQLCPQIDVQYALLNATHFFNIHDGILYTNTYIDHDSMAPGPQMSANVQCRLTNKANANVRTLNRLLNFVILDRNDNPPELHTTDTNISVQLKDPYFTKGLEIGKGILFSDSDTLSQNSKIIYEILNDYRQLVEPKCQAFEVKQFGLYTSAINCKLYFSRTGFLNHSPYCVIIRASDSTVENVSSMSAEATICIIADLTKVHEADRTLIVPQALKSNNDHDMQAKKEQKISYPKEVTLPRQSTTLYRVVEPIRMLDLVKNGGPIFRISIDPTSALGITSAAGIVYVKNATALRASSDDVYNLAVVFFNQTARIIIRLINVRNEINATDLHFVPCSSVGTRDECLSISGYGTDGSGCQWRANNSTTLTATYATCSPALETCPNLVCDPLEDLSQQNEQFLCPQDCTSAEDIFGPHTISDSRTGIRSAYGICTCDVFGKCSCGHLPDVKENPSIKINGKSRQSNSITTNMTMQIYRAPDIYGAIKGNIDLTDCGIMCILLVMCPLILVLFIMSVALRIQYKKQKRKNQKPGNADDVNQNTSETMSLSQLTSNRIAIHSGLSNECSFVSDPDSKWEFPRSRLVLDTVLGEGEFGRVVRGFATDISDKAGVTTVAVKMLKNNANSVELLALLSEFQLLQEVTHPNVIQLLGACTKESPLLIIEYAKHGSLRNYLRFGRKLECCGIEFSDGVEPMTVRDILSFALQICKGMAYLTEIKLVHRDLAARNVLLAEGKICKISDFGLTRDIYEDDAYLKRSKDRVPVKWLSPESLADHVYTTRSDVWAFGVLAWELITLGASPYPGIPPQNLYHLLKTGYRMERPDNCSEEVYSIIQSCWTDDPHMRPPFKWLALQWARLLGNNAKYIEMEMNSVSNPLYCFEKQKIHSDMCNESFDEANSTLVDDITAKQNIMKKEFCTPDKIEHLWSPPRSLMQSATPDKTSSTSTQKPDLSYDIPRALIDSHTDEQFLRYQNEIRTSPLRTYAKRRNSDNRSLNFSHYDRPTEKRDASYIDMTSLERTGSAGYNLDRQNVKKKRLTKDISFRFSSLLNLTEH